ncbi:MAG: hypothetical protein AAF196_16560 [Planctomycetota bacterium]
MASPGGIVIVRQNPPGMPYPSVILSQSVTLRGEGGSQPVLTGLSIMALSGSGRVVVSNLAIETLGPVGLVLDGCLGRVHLDRVVAGANGLLGLDVEFRNSTSVTMTDVGPLNTILIEDSRVAACNLIADVSASINVSNQPTVRLVRSTLSLASSTVSGVSRVIFAPCGGGVVPTAGISLDQSELTVDRATTVSGGSVTAFVRGFPAPVTCGTAPPFVGPSGTVRGPTATGSEPGLTFSQESVFPSTVAYDTNGDLQVSVAAEGNAGGFLFVSPLANASTAIMPFVTWLDLSATISIGFIPASAQGDCLLTLPAPSGLPLGLPLTWQWLFGTPSGIVLGEPVTSLVR